ncbi:hypothetical protein BWI93_05235 [Siphonobacter sp. BAB-5385]|uniref:hypothetical protein n=1 Tax=Siphonobacter sp. BAB-5385 TaxID=1864822 RepID=UPI000B9E0BF5|nr:hypothetical protein [Siphonobacter sp. BAB-5385]OZI09210.1 hypothetical protein BWI93_05235 [Siphonobacter sp. BAB-5385]
MTEENLYSNCIRTYTGKYVNVFEPDPETICIEDIAHALSNMPRFGGHLPEFYSVAQHSIRCAQLVPDHLKLSALMHDASEAYLMDLPRPIKKNLGNFGYAETEERLMGVIAQKFGFQLNSKEVKAADERVLTEEWNGLMLEKDVRSVFPHLGGSHQYIEVRFLALFNLYLPV